jgi:hypothetical protein
VFCDETADAVPAGLLVGRLFSADFVETQPTFLPLLFLARRFARYGQRGARRIPSGICRRHGEKTVPARLGRSST